MVVERVAICPVKARPQPEAALVAGVCTIQGPDGPLEVVCMPPESAWALDRLLSALSRWADEVTACPGVVEGESGVTEELGKL